MIRWGAGIGSVMVLCLSACRTESWDTVEGLFVERPVAVRLQERTRGSESIDQGFAHPATLDSDALTRALNSLGYKKKGEGGLGVPVFPREQVGALARAICDGLDRATPSQRVSFSCDRKQTRAFFANWNTSRGVAFVKPAGTLNLVFETVDRQLEFSEEMNWTEPTDIQKSGLLLVLPEGARGYADESGRYPLWFTLPLDPGPVAAVPETPVDNAGVVAPVQVPSRPAERAPVQETPTAEPPAEARGVSGTDAELLTRLRQLEELYQEGLLSAEDYARKRKELLLGDGE